MNEKSIKIADRVCHVVSDEREVQCVIVKPLGEFERLLLVDECRLIKEMTDIPFAMYAFEVNEQDLWEDGIKATYEFLTSALLPAIRLVYPTLPYILGGYSLGGLFALVCATKTDAFSAVAACSPSLWVDGWNEYADQNQVKASAVYLSVGDKEANTKKGKYACINERIHQQQLRHEALLGGNCKLEINSGGHFNEIEKRKAKGFSWCMECIIHQR